MFSPSRLDELCMMYGQVTMASRAEQLCVQHLYPHVASYRRRVRYSQFSVWHVNLDPSVECYSVPVLQMALLVSLTDGRVFRVGLIPPMTGEVGSRATSRRAARSLLDGGMMRSGTVDQRVFKFKADCG